MFRHLNVPDPQDRKMYDFYVGDDARLHVRSYDRYRVSPGKRNTPTYWIFAPQGVVTKRLDQMDRVINGHYYTLHADRGVALAAFREHHETRLAEARAVVEKERAALDAVDAAAKSPTIPS